ncbi:MAG: Rne/Rng family ribonuclease [Firmicutes bacterium]|nr:Rne/Rng family ribonuclease [Bacillota bacterium]
MNEIIIDVGFKQDRVAILEDDDLVELYIEREDGNKILGNVYKGRVVNVLPGMEAAFVDIGFEKNAFLHIKDAIPKSMILNKDIDLKNISIKDVVKTGLELIVQVIKEPFGTKGARITTHITLPGRHLVLMPYTNYIGISRRITNENERDRLKGIMEEIKPDNIGVILRTAAEGKGMEELKDDMKFLLKLFNKIDRERNLGFAPRTIYRDLDLVHRVVRDMFTSESKRLVINDRDKYKSIVELVELISPHLQSKVEYFDNSHDIFGHYGIESQISHALERKVWLKSGGYIVIDETEALTSIDVNTGKYVGKTNLEDTVVKTNLEAARAIAKQLRLRNIGGIIIIDFIDMNNKDDDNLVLKALEESLKKDRTKAAVLGMTQLGLVEMTRKKARKRLTTKLLRECPYCSGKGKVSSEHVVINKLRTELKRIKLHTNSEAVLVEVNPELNEILHKNNRDVLKELEEKFEISILVNSTKELHFNDINIKSMGKTENMKKLMEISLSS